MPSLSADQRESRLWRCYDADTGELLDTQEGESYVINERCTGRYLSIKHTLTLREALAHANAER